MMEGSLFLFRPDFSFSPDKESVITAFWAKAHCNNKLHSEVLSLLVVTNRRFIIYRTESIRGYWFKLIIGTTVGKIPVVGSVVSWVTEKVIDGIFFVVGKVNPKERNSKEEIAELTPDDLLLNKKAWQVTFEKDLKTLKQELKQIHIANKRFMRFILLDTKSFWKSLRYPMIKYRAPDDFLFLCLQVKNQERELSSWFDTSLEDQEVILKPHN
jgi:hypothetical protein